MKTVKFYTLGCKVNQYDTQSMRERFIQAGFQELEDGECADVCVINTCTVTHRADADSLNIIRKAKRQNPKAKIMVTGCLAELKKDSDRIKEIGDISRILKNKDKANIPEILLRHHKPIASTGGYGISYFKGRARAFLKVQDGCNHFCSYCKVPLVRGPSQSRPMDDIIQEAKRLVHGGHKEIVLSGICLGAYGKDLRPKINLLRVIEELEKLERLIFIRLSSIELNDITPELIKKVAQSKKLCPHLHIPLQSGDDEILKKMNRKYTGKDFLNKILEIRKIVPEIAITTDVLVGFPGESQRAFRNTISLIKKMMPLRVHIFPYSPRKHTKAFSFDGIVDQREKRERIMRLRKVSESCSLSYRKQFLGRKMQVLVEGRGKEGRNQWEGYTNNYIKARVVSGRELINRIIPLCLKRIEKGCMWGDFS